MNENVNYTCNLQPKLSQHAVLLCKHWAGKHYADFVMSLLLALTNKHCVRVKVLFLENDKLQFIYKKHKMFCAKGFCQPDKMTMQWLGYCINL